MAVPPEMLDEVSKFLVSVGLMGEVEFNEEV
jgi:hypothetical protein